MFSTCCFFPDVNSPQINPCRLHLLFHGVQKHVKARHVDFVENQEEADATTLAMDCSAGQPLLEKNHASRILAATYELSDAS